MNKIKLNQYVEAYLNNRTDLLEVDANCVNDSLDKYILRSVIRLRNNYELYKKQKDYLDDFLIALRDYLLVLQVDISLESLSIPSNNEYGIIKDDSTGKYFALYQFPDYVNALFAESAFDGEKIKYFSNQYDYDLHTDPLIYKLTGFKNFKSREQKLAVYGALKTPEGYSTLVALPTGGGKSLIIHILAYQQEGLTIVIVPTVSLAIDQVRIAKSVIRSRDIDEEIFCYYSGLDAGPILTAIRNKTAKLLFISPETLINNSKFVDAINNANKSKYLKNIIIDEAHIVVDWGASFRVDYQCLESWQNKLLQKNSSIRTILLSATFEEKCVNILKDFFSKDGEKWIEIRCDSLRHEPRFMLIKAKSYQDKEIKMLELVQKMPHPMIIYVARPSDAVDVESILQKNGIKNTKIFTGKTSTNKRQELIDGWVNNKFEIMIATSAFGVGVDKEDVRTVLHMYIPQNPNSYYQELGRGGRDGLTCLSIMCCFCSEDLNITFNRIKKSVLTTQKILGRWDSMYNSVHSTRIRNMIIIDTSLKPNYEEQDILDDTPASDIDMNWNIYVLLFLRRYGMIKIHDIISDNFKYFFVIEVLDESLQSNDVHLFEIIESFRSMEWQYYLDSFHVMDKAIKNSKEICWSEMFYETYNKVSEYCGGCNCHNMPIGNDSMDFPIKLPVEQSHRVLTQYQIKSFSKNKEMVIIPTKDETLKLLEAIGKLKPSSIIFMSEGEVDNFLDEADVSLNLMLLNQSDFKELVANRCLYYISGLIIVKYSGTPRDIYEFLIYIINWGKKHSENRIIHVIDENVYFDWIDKAFVDLVNGPVIPVKAVVS